MAAETRQKWFEVDVNRAGSIKQRGDNYGFSFRSIDKPRYQSDLPRTVFVFDGKVLLTNEIASFLADTRYCRQFIKIGRRRFYVLDESFKDEAMRGITYPARSEREEQVAERNFELLTWLEGLA